MNPLLVPPLLALAGFLLVQVFLSEELAGVAITQARTQWRDGLASLRKGSGHRLLSWLLLSIWLLAFGGDALTTSIGMHSGAGSEANPLATFTFGFMGADVAMVLVSLAFLALAPFTLASPRHRVLYLLVVPLWVVVAIKLYAVGHNVLILWS